MVFEIQYNEDPAIIWVFAKDEKDWLRIKEDKNFKLSEPTKLDINLDTTFIDNSSLDVLILEPLPGFEDFVIVYSKVNKLLSGRVLSSRYEKITGLLYGELFSYMKKYLIPPLVRVYKNHKSEFLEVVIYNDDQLIENIKIEIIYNKGYIYLLHIDETNVILRNQENSLIHTLYDEDKGTLFTKGIDGKYYWDPSIYEILERKPRTEDTSYNILKDVMAPEDFEKLQMLEEYDCDLNQDKVIATITTENNKNKILQFYTTTSYDTFGKFRFKLIYVLDVTKETLEKQDSAILDILVSRMNLEFGTGNFVVHPERGALFTPEVENITNLHYCKNYVSELSFHKYFDGVHFMKIFEEFWKKVVDYDKYSDSITKLFAGEIDKMDTVLDYNFEDGEELRRLHFIFQKEIIDGEIYFLAGVQDVTEEYNRENELIKANSSLNLLIKESNHRIKNNLNILLRYISLEKRLNKDNLGEVIDKMELRIKALDLFHSLLYKGPSSEEVWIMDYFKNFAITVADVYPSYEDIVFTSDDDGDFKVSADKIVPLSLITNELLANSFKHAYVNFPIDKKVIHGAIYKNGNCCDILYRDNGVGVPDNFNPKETSGLGWVIINALVDQLNGKYEVYNDEGMCFRLTFPLE